MLYFGFQCLRSWKKLEVKLCLFLFISFLLPTSVEIVWVSGLGSKDIEKTFCLLKTYMDWKKLYMHMHYVCFAYIYRVCIPVWAESYWKGMINIGSFCLLSAFGVLGPGCADSKPLGRPLSAVGSFPAKYCSLARLNSWISVARF